MSGLVMTCEEAIGKFVNDGDTIAIGGFVASRKPYGLVHEIVRQRKKNLYIEGSGAGGETDLLIGAGCVRLIINAYVANGAFGNIGRRFRKGVEKGEIEFDDYSLDVQPLRFHAAALGLPFIPVRHMMRGSDIERVWGIDADKYKNDPKLASHKLLLEENPFNPGEKVVYLPVPKIDVALIHVNKAARDGTARIEGPVFIDVDIAMAAERVIISFEEEIDPEEIRREPWLNQIPCLVPDALVHMPFGAHPSQCPGVYDYDPQFFYHYDHASRDDRLFEGFVEEYIYDTKDHAEYINKIGMDSLLRLRVGEKNYVEKLSRRRKSS